MASSSPLATPVVAACRPTGYDSGGGGEWQLTAAGRLPINKSKIKRRIKITKRIMSKRKIKRRSTSSFSCSFSCS
jgi:hypothetical protein